MVVFLRNRRTGKFAGSIGNGKNNIPTIAPQRPPRRVIVPLTAKEIKEIEIREELERITLETKKHNLLVADLNLNLKAKQNLDGTLTVSVFRCGTPEAPKQRGVEGESYTLADAIRPADGCTGRTEAVFAAPSLGGVMRWVQGSHRIKPDIKIRELRINADTTYIYKVREWEKASYGTDEDKHAYWATGMTYREWVTRALGGDKTLEPEEWELLVPEEGILMAKPVSADRAAANVYETSYFTNPKRISEMLKKNR